jgi:hypothetical protein
MRRKNKDAPPTRILTFGCLPPDRPGGIELLVRQLLLALKFWNMMVPIEKQRRREVREALAAHPDVAPLAARVKELEDEIKDLRSGLKAAKARMSFETKEGRERVRELRESLKSLRESLKEAKAKLKAATKLSRASMAPDVASLATRVKEFVDEIKSLCLGLKAGREEAKERIGAVKKRVHDVIESLKPVRAARDAAKAKIENDPEVELKKKAANDVANAALKLAYGAIRAEGLGWGTCLLVGKAMEEARKGHMDPKFHGSPDVGRVGVQVQGGMPVSKLFGEGTLVRLAPVPEGAYALPRSERERATRSRVMLRVGSQDKRAPVWLELPVILHRPLPEDGVVKWAWILRTRVGNRYRHELQLSVEAPSFGSVAPEGKDAAAIDIGWRLVDRDAPTDQLRIGYYVDSKGNATEIRLPADVSDRLSQCDALRATREGKFNEAIKLLTAYMKNTSSVLPEWFVAATLTIPHWKSFRRLIRLVQTWSERRWKGDESIYAALVEWGKKEKHLYAWEADGRAGALARRKDFYRNTARVISMRIGALVLEDFDLRPMARLPQPEGEPVAPQVQRRNRHAVALSEFRSILKAACKAQGVPVIKVPAQWTTIDCHVCKEHILWDAAPQIMHKCAKCGADWDQDFNAAVNMLDRAQLPTPPVNSRKMITLYTAPLAISGSVRKARKERERKERGSEAKNKKKKAA